MSSIVKVVLSLLVCILVNVPKSDLSKCTHTHTLAHAHTRSHAHKRAHTHTHTHTHTHKHTHESIGSVRSFRARFASQLVQFGDSERVSRVNWFSSGIQSAFRESIGLVRGFRACFVSQLVQFGASECVSRVNWFRSGL